MTDETRPRGPWDPAPVDPNAAPEVVRQYKVGPVEVRFEKTAAAEPALDKGQNPVWAVISTLALAGLIWWLTGSVIVAGAAIFGLFVHEYGHVLAMNRYGMGPARIYIVPFFGGFARGQRGASSEWDGVKVSLAGPAFGLLAAIPFFGLWAVTGMADWLLGAFIIAIINLVNLAPAPPLDGSKALGPVLARVHPGLEKAAMVLIGLVGVAWGIMTGFYFLAIVLGIALLGQLKRGVRVAEGRPLTARESGFSLALFALSLIACAAVAVAALTPVAGSVGESLTFGLRYLGVGR